MAADCVFCEIVAGRIPALRLWENSAAVAFLDVAPLAPGHTLVVPRQHIQRIFEMTPDAWADATCALPMLAAAILRVTGAAGINVLQNNGRAAGQAVDHLHVHLIPRREGDSLGFRWNVGAYGPGEADALAARLKAALT